MNLCLFFFFCSTWNQLAYIGDNVAYIKWHKGICYWNGIRLVSASSLFRFELLMMLGCEMACIARLPDDFSFFRPTQSNIYFCFVFLHWAGFEPQPLDSTYLNLVDALAHSATTADLFDELYSPQFSPKN